MLLSRAHVMKIENPENVSEHFYLVEVYHDRLGTYVPVNVPYLKQSEAVAAARIYAAGAHSVCVWSSDEQVDAPTARDIR